MPYVATRRIENYGGREYLPGDAIYKLPSGNEATWRAFVERRWIVPADESLASVLEKDGQEAPHRRPGRPSRTA